MKFKKFISSSLTMGLLFNLILPSFASTLSEDGRYETFEGSNITINNVLEEDEVDVEMAGNTMINIFDGVITVNTQNVYSIYENNKLIFGSQDGYTGSISNSYIGQIITNKDFVGGNTYTMYFKCNLENVKFGLKGRSDTGGGTGSEYMITTKKGFNKFVFTLDKDISLVNNFAFRVFQTSTRDNHVFEDFVILEGDISYDYIDYFEGIKSSFENNLVTKDIVESRKEASKNLDKYKIEIKSIGKNLFNPENTINKVFDENFLNDCPNSNVFLYKDEWYVGDVLASSEGILYGSTKAEYKGVKLIANLKPNTYYTISYTPTVRTQDTFSGKWNAVEANNKRVVAIQSDSSGIINGTIETTGMYSGILKDFQIEEGLVATEYELYKESINTFYLNQPLRGLPNGVKDRITRRNGQWVVERNCREIILDGTENWSIGTESNGWTIYDDSLVVYTDSYTLKANSRYMCDKLPYIGGSGVCAQNVVGTSNQTWSSVGHISIRLPYSRLGTENLHGFKQWLSKNNLKIVYQLAEPIYEPLNTNLTLDLYLETTHISNNSTIPANMKVTVDRAANRAKEAIELAKENPTIENISLARMWANLLKESTLKDTLQNDINEIVEISDLNIEKKTATANLDLYVKSNNSLTMSLSTNSVTFEGYSGVEDLEMLDAVNITINSSLPYSLNAYMPVQMSNADGSNTMDTNILNIRDNTESNYSQFINTTDKVVLKDSCVAGNNNIHGIDLKLSGNNLHKADVYKTVIKFEAEQK